MRDIITEILTLTNVTSNTLGTATETIGSRDHVSGDARFHLNITTLAGSSPTATVFIMAPINEVNMIVGSFAVKSASGQESIVIQACPVNVLAYVVVGGTVTDLDGMIWCNRL